MGEHEQDVSIAELKRDMASLKRRMEKTEEIVSVVHRLAQEMVGLTKEVGFMNNTLAQLTAKVSDLESTPGKRWEGLVTALIGAAVGAIVTMFFG